MSKIHVSANCEVPKEGNKTFETACDDAIMIFSNINGAVMGAAKNGDPAYTRKVSAWCGGFASSSEVLTRLSQGALQIFTASDNQEANEYNLVNFIQFLIDHGGLKDKVHLSVSEELIANTREGKKQ